MSNQFPGFIPASQLNRTNPQTGFTTSNPSLMTPNRNPNHLSNLPTPPINPIVSNLSNTAPQIANQDHRSSFSSTPFSQPGQPLMPAMPVSSRLPGNSQISNPFQPLNPVSVTGFQPVPSNLSTGQFSVPNTGSMGVSSQIGTQNTFAPIQSGGGLQIPSTTEVLSNTRPVGYQSSLDESKKKLIDKKRINDFLSDWANLTSQQLESFSRISRGLSDAETTQYKTSVDLFSLKQVEQKIEVSHRRMVENLDLIAQEQVELNQALNAIDENLKSFSKASELKQKHNKENLPVAIGSFSSWVSQTEKMLQSITRVFNELHEGKSSALEHTLDVLFDSLEGLEQKISEIDKHVSFLNSS